MVYVYGGAQVCFESMTFFGARFFDEVLMIFEEGKKPAFGFSLCLYSKTNLHSLGISTKLGSNSKGDRSATFRLR